MMPAISSAYYMALWAIFLILLIWLVQWFIASSSKARYPGAIPGKLPPELSHESFVFRAHRTFMNPLENLPILLSTAFLAIFVGASPFWTGVLLWVYALARLGHMILYYQIATEKNPSPRTFFFMLGFLANVGLLLMCGLTLL
ncbi:MAPEG family protein [Methylophaga sp.]|uniref:MAPEG family protein n=1 Tax=Methylophaga sp. TaxID=2024840 RepID=UPI0025D3221F|nr:MAPEG family protein [Methylophaga sp.]